MSTATVSNTITDASGTPVPNVDVLVVLYPDMAAWGTGPAGIAPIQTQTDGSGVWSLALERTDTMTPSADWQYAVYEEKNTGASFSRGYLINVPGAGPYTVDEVYRGPIGTATIPPLSGSVLAGNDITVTGSGPWNVAVSSDEQYTKVYDAGGREVNAGAPRFEFVFDMHYATDLAITSGAATLTSPGNNLTGAVAGQCIYVEGAGVAGVPLAATILSVQSTGQVTLSTNASSTVTGKRGHWGTDNTTPFANARAAAGAAGGRLTFPHGKRFVADTQTLSDADLHEVDFNRSVWGAKTPGSPAFSSTVDQDGLKLHDGYYRGCADPNAPLSGANNTFAYLLGSTGGGVGATGAKQTGVHIYRMKIVDASYTSVLVVDCQDVRLYKNRCVRCGGIANLQSCTDFEVSSNIFDNENYTQQFSAGIALNVGGSVPSGAHNKNGKITGNQIDNFPCGEAILIHDLSGGTVSNNHGDAVAAGIIIGVSINTLEQVNNIKVSGNRFTGTIIPGATANWTSGCAFIGQSGGTHPYIPTDITFNNNDFSGFNFAITCTDGSITSGAAILTSPSDPFGGVVAGMTVNVAGAGAAGGVLTTTVLSVQDSGQITLASNASTTVSGTAHASIGAGKIGHGGMVLFGGLTDCDLSGNRLKANYGSNLGIATTGGPLIRINLSRTRGYNPQNGYLAGERNSIFFEDNTDVIEELDLSHSRFEGGGASAIATMSGGAVTGFVVKHGGYGYTTAPTVTISGGLGSGAAGTAVLTNGVVTSITLDAGGSGYVSAPNVSLTGLAIGLDIPPGRDLSGPGTVHVNRTRFSGHLHNWNTLSGGAAPPLFPDGGWHFHLPGIMSAVTQNGMGTGGSVGVAAVSGHVLSDMEGVLVLTTGHTGISAGVRWIQTTLGTTYPNGAIRGVVVTPLDAATAALGPWWSANATGGAGWQILSTVTPAIDTVYTVHYRLILDAIQN